MKALIHDFIPNAPDHGLFVQPGIPAGKIRAAISDYAEAVAPRDVLALYDATRLGSAKDGALFLDDRFIFQNNDLQSPRAIRYEDIVGVKSKRQLLGGKRVELEVNRGRATILEVLDFSAHAGAAEFIERFLREAMLQGGIGPEADARTDLEAVSRALNALVASGELSVRDRQRLLDVFG